MVMLHKKDRVIEGKAPLKIARLQKPHISFGILLKKKIIIFEKCVIVHTLFKFVLYNNCNCENWERSGSVNNSSIRWTLGFIMQTGTGAAAILSSLAVAFLYDENANYFAPNSKLFPIAVICAIIAFVAAILLAIVIPKEETISKSPFGARLMFALPAALGFGVGAILLAIEFAKSQKFLFLVAIFFLLLSAAHVLLSETDRVNTFLGFVPPIACALLVAVLYFDTSLEMNAPLKVVAQCALLPLMLYFTAELRYLLGREIPRLYLALALGSIAASSLCVFAVPLASFIGALNNTPCLAAALTVAGTNVTILLRLKRYLKPIHGPENETKETDAQ